MRRVLVVLCATEITSWGVLYYAFPVLAGHITAGTGWSATAVTAAFSAGQVVTALVGIPVGRWLDRRGPRGVMTAGSALGVVAVVAVATARTLGWFVVGWLLVGMSSAAVLYPPAFAALTRWHGPHRVRALTGLTLVAGLASTVFAPLTAALAGWLDWRGAYLVLAAILAIVTIPAHGFGLRLPWPPQVTAASHRAFADPRAVARSRPFLALTVTLSLAAFASFAVVVNLVPLLVGRGVTTGAAAVGLGLGGVGQVTGRLGYGTLARRTAVRTRTALVLVAMAATIAMLAGFTAPAALLAAAVLAGMARGMFTLLLATAVTDRWGSAHYGRLTGMLSAPLTITMALAPFAGAALADLLGGYPPAFLALACAALAAAVLSLAASPRPQRDCGVSLDVRRAAPYTSAGAD